MFDLSAIQELAAKFTSNPDLMANIKSAVAGKDPEAAMTAIVDIAKQYGIAVDPAQLQGAGETLMGLISGQGGGVMDTIQNLAGGFFGGNKDA